MGYVDLIPNVFRLTASIANNKTYRTQKFNVGNKQCIGVTVKASQALSIAVAYGIATDTAASAGVDQSPSLPYKTSATTFASNNSTEGGTYHELAIPPHARQAQLVISNASGSDVASAVFDAALRVVAYPASGSGGGGDFASITGWPGSSSQVVRADGSYSALSDSDMPAGSKAAVIAAKATPAYVDSGDAAVAASTASALASEASTRASADTALAAPQYVCLTSNATLANERVLTGTTNQVIVTDGGAGGNVTLSTPQDIGTGSSPQFAGINLGHASDTTLTRSAPGIVAAEGVDLVGVSTTQNLSNKTFTTAIALTGTQTTLGPTGTGVYRDANGSLRLCAPSGGFVPIDIAGTQQASIGANGLVLNGNQSSAGTGVVSWYRDSSSNLIGNVGTGAIIALTITGTNYVDFRINGINFATAHTAPANTAYGIYREGTLSQNVLQGPTSGVAHLYGAGSGLGGSSVKAHGETNADRPGAITLRGGGVAKANAGTWGNFYSLAEGTHYGNFKIFVGGYGSYYQVSIANTGLSQIYDGLSGAGLACTTGGSPSSSQVGFRVSGGNLQIYVGTSVTNNLKFMAIYEGNVS